MAKLIVVKKDPTKEKEVRVYLDPSSAEVLGQHSDLQILKTGPDEKPANKFYVILTFPVQQCLLARIIETVAFSTEAFVRSGDWYDIPGG